MIFDISIHYKIGGKEANNAQYVKREDNLTEQIGNKEKRRKDSTVKAGDGHFPPAEFFSLWAGP